MDGKLKPLDVDVQSRWLHFDDRSSITPREVNFYLLASAQNIAYPRKLVIDMERLLLVLNVNGLLCEAIHLRSSKRWKPLILPIRCGNKRVSVQPNCHEFLELCNSMFDNAIWSSLTQHNLQPMVQFLLGLQSGLNPLFVWGVENCLETNIPHSLNPHCKLII